MKCYDCPRGCGADREDGESGYCGIGADVGIAKVINDFEYEEPCLGERLTAVFFAGCSLGCSYCQNYKISRGMCGEAYDTQSLAALLDSAPNDIDLVTPSHCITALERAVTLCTRRRRMIFNTSGYDTVKTVVRARRFCDVFLADMKYAEPEIAQRYSNASDYFDVTIRALTEMRKTADEWTEKNGRRILERGLVVRHLVLPGHVSNSLKVLDAVKSELGTDTVISLMSQFTPNGVGEPYVRLKSLEYKIVAEHAVKLGFKTGYIQDTASADVSYTPKF